MAFNPWAGFGQQQFPPGFGGFGGVPMYGGGWEPPVFGGGQQPGWGPVQGPPPGWTPQQGQDRIQASLPDQGVNQAPPPRPAPPQGGNQVMTGPAPVSGGSQYPDWFVQAGQQNGMNPRQMEVEWQRYMASQGDGGRNQVGMVGGFPVGGGRQPDMGGGRYTAVPLSDYADERSLAAQGGGWGRNQIPPGGFSGGGRGINLDARINPDGSVSGRNANNEWDPWTPGSGNFAPPMYGGENDFGRGGKNQMGMVGGAPVGGGGRLPSGGKDNAPPSGQAAGSGKWQYHANGTRTWKPNKPKPAAKPPVVVKPGPGGGPTPGPSTNTNTRPYETDPPQPGPSMTASDNVPKVKPLPGGGTQTPPIYVPDTEIKSSSGSMPSLAASVNKRRY